MTTTRKPSMVATVASCVLIAIVAFYLFTEHLQHTLGALPYLILLLCPLMHVFMHRGHGHGGHHHGGHGHGDGHGGHPHRDPANPPRTTANPEEA